MPYFLLPSAQEIPFTDIYNKKHGIPALSLLDKI
jgi:hypothetical protein